MSRPQKIIPPIKGEFQGIINTVADGKGMPPRQENAQKYQVIYMLGTSRPKVHGERSDTADSWDELINLVARRGIKFVKEIRLANGRQLEGNEILHLWKDCDAKKLV